MVDYYFEIENFSGKMATTTTTVLNDDADFEEQYGRLKTQHTSLMRYMLALQERLQVSLVK
jgi:hypothetical protein